MVDDIKNIDEIMNIYAICSLDFPTGGTTYVGEVKLDDAGENINPEDITTALKRREDVKLTNVVLFSTQKLLNDAGSYNSPLNYKPQSHLAGSYYKHLVQCYKNQAVRSEGNSIPVSIVPLKDVVLSILYTRKSKK